MTQDFIKKVEYSFDTLCCSGDGSFYVFDALVKDMWKDEPLDGDETEDISNMVLAELDNVNGNLEVI